MKTRQTRQRGGNVNENLWNALRYYDRESLEYYLEKGADVNFVNMQQTPLARMCSKLNDSEGTDADKILEIIETLLKHGADPNIRETFGDRLTPIFYLVQYPTEQPYHTYQALKLLLEHGANPHIQLTNGMTPLQYAIKNEKWYEKDESLVDLLKEYGADGPKYNMLPERVLPTNTSNAIMRNVIKNGNAMVNFHDESMHGRYYKKSTFNSLPLPKQNPFTRRNIQSTNVIHYKAKLEGGKRKQKTRKCRM